MTELILPESLTYHAVPAHAAALSRIGRAEHIPADLALPEVRQFHLARLTLLKIKTDYWCLLHDIWNAVWGPLVGGFDPLPFGSHLWDDGAGEIDTVWMEAMLSASHRLNARKHLWSAVCLDHAGRSLSLRMAVETKGAGADPDWLAFAAPEGWVLVHDDKVDYAPFWQADIPAATEVEGRIRPAPAAAAAYESFVPVIATLEV